MRPQPQPAPEPPLSRLERLRRRLGRFYTRFHSAFLVGVGMLIALAAVLLYDATKLPPQRLTQRDIDAAVARTLAAATPRPSDASVAYAVIRPSLVQVLPPETTGDAAIGAGVVIEDNGLILTSLHIITDAAQVRVVFADGTESAARVVMRLPENDLALLLPGLLPDDLMPATLAGSDGLNVGAGVFVVGNPFGIAHSLSAGVVSGFGREFRRSPTGEPLKDLIQFDAAVNPGSSGGPLLNSAGEVVGVVTGLLNPTGQDVFVGVGFAVPIETAAAAMGSPPY